MPQRVGNGLAKLNVIHHRNSWFKRYEVLDRRSEPVPKCVKNGHLLPSRVGKIVNDNDMVEISAFPASHVVAIRSQRKRYQIPCRKPFPEACHSACRKRPVENLPRTKPHKPSFHGTQEGLRIAKPRRHVLVVHQVYSHVFADWHGSLSHSDERRTIRISISEQGTLIIADWGQATKPQNSADVLFRSFVACPRVRRNQVLSDLHTRAARCLGQLRRPVPKAGEARVLGRLVAHAWLKLEMRMASAPPLATSGLFRPRIDDLYAAVIEIGGVAGRNGRTV